MTDAAAVMMFLSVLAVCMAACVGWIAYLVLRDDEQGYRDLGERDD
jgi:hypothetical protein